MNARTRNMLLIAYVVLALPSVHAFWRMECRARSGVGQVDPLMTPGEVSPHAHVIHGSGGFGFSANEASLKASDCTSCAVTQDKSAYWTPSLMFMHDNGISEMVTQVGGMLAYYMLNGQDIQAFPPGFQMISGDTFRRNSTLPSSSNPDAPDPNSLHPDDTSQSALRQKALGFNCLHYQSTPEGSLQRHGLPSKEYLDTNCNDGIRLELMFPSCWNGKDADSPDHQSHVAFPDGVMAGTCPQGFDKRLPSMFYETIFDTSAFKGKAGQFVISNGDPTGYGYHGDFIAGWDQSFLQNAINKCTNPSGRIQDCAPFTIQDQSDADKCKFPVPKQIAKINYLGTNKGLPGGVQIQSGPGYATEQPLPLVAAAATPGPASSAPGVFAEASSSTPPPAPSPAYQPASSPAPAPPPPPASPASPAPPPPPPPASSPAATPEPAPPSTPTASALTTSVYTTNGEVVNMVIMQATTTVTVGAESTPAAKEKRASHLHRHLHVRRQHQHHDIQRR